MVAAKPTPTPDPMKRNSTMTSNLSLLDLDTEEGGTDAVAGAFDGGGPVIRLHCTGSGQPYSLYLP